MLCFLCRPVWCSSSGHARLHAWRDASLWAGSSYGAPIPGRASHGHETTRHVSSRTLLKPHCSHCIRFEVNTFLSSLCFFKPSSKKRTVEAVAVTTNDICYNTWTFNVTSLLRKKNSQRPHTFLTNICDELITCEDVYINLYIYLPIGLTQVCKSEVW